MFYAGFFIWHNYNPKTVRYIKENPAFMGQGNSQKKSKKSKLYYSITSFFVTPSAVFTR